MCCFDLIDKVELFKAIVMLLVMWFELNPDHGGLALSLSSLFFLLVSTLVFYSRQALGLPLEEPGRYKEDSFFGKDEYDPSNPLYRYDYWGEPKNSEKSLQERMRDAHNKSIVGKGMVWYEMSYDDVIKQKMQREARSKRVTLEEEEEDSTSGHGNGDDDDDDFDYSILSDSSSLSFSNQPVVNGTESSSISDEGMFED